MSEKTGLNTSFIWRPTGEPLTPNRQTQSKYKIDKYTLQNVNTSSVAPIPLKLGKKKALI